MNSINSIMREIKRFSEWKPTVMKTNIKADEVNKTNSGSRPSMWPGALRGYGPITMKLEGDNYGFARA